MYNLTVKKKKKLTITQIWPRNRMECSRRVFKHVIVLISTLCRLIMQNIIFHVGRFDYNVMTVFRSKIDNR